MRLFCCFYRQSQKVPKKWQGGEKWDWINSTAEIELRCFRQNRGAFTWPGSENKSGSCFSICLDWDVYKGLIKRSDPKHVKIIKVPLGLGSKKTKASKCGLGRGCQSATRLLLGQLTAAFPSHKFQPGDWIRVWTRVPRKRELWETCGRGLRPGSQGSRGAAGAVVPQPQLTWCQVELLSWGSAADPPGDLLLPCQGWADTHASSSWGGANRESYIWEMAELTWLLPSQGCRLGL